MRARAVPIAIVLAGLCGPPAPATALRAGLTAVITVYPDFGACALVTYPRPVVAAGHFASAGAVTGPGTATAPVRGLTPVVLTGTTSWYGCLPDAYAGATTGTATYHLVLTSPDGLYVEVVVCTLSAGMVNC